jgi:hypothetical protein
VPNPDTDFDAELTYEHEYAIWKILKQPEWSREIDSSAMRGCVVPWFRVCS